MQPPYSGINRTIKISNAKANNTIIGAGINVRRLTKKAAISLHKVKG